MFTVKIKVKTTCEGKTLYFHFKSVNKYSLELAKTMEKLSTLGKASILLSRIITTQGLISSKLLIAKFGPFQFLGLATLHLRSSEKKGSLKRTLYPEPNIFFTSVRLVKMTLYKIKVVHPILFKIIIKVVHI